MGAVETLWVSLTKYQTIIIYIYMERTSFHYSTDINSPVSPKTVLGGPTWGEGLGTHVTLFVVVRRWPPANWGSPAVSQRATQSDLVGTLSVTFFRSLIWN
jgi:hypothetical protein